MLQAHPPLDGGAVASSHISQPGDSIMRVPNIMLAASVCLAVVVASVLPLPAASPNAASHVTAKLVTDSHGVTSLVITGDQKDNTITVTEVNGEIYVIGEKK